MTPLSPKHKQSSHVFHILTEAEPFSEFSGGALSRWTANVLRHDSHSVVLTPAADDSWGFDPARVCVVPALRMYRRLNTVVGSLLRWPIRSWLLRRILMPSLTDLIAGDAIWIHNRPEFAAALAPFAARRSVKIVLVLHNSHLVEWPETIVRTVRADHLAFVSHFLQQEALHKFSWLQHTHVLHGGADKSVFYPRSAPKPANEIPVVVFAGRIVPEKGVHVLLQAMQILQQHGIDLKAIVVGGSGFGDSLPTKYTQKLHQTATSNVVFEPYLSGTALAEKFRDADIFCAPSTWNEPLGLVILEAMATGLPIVATRSGGIPEMFTEGGGILVERNSAVELADALAQLATDVQLRSRLGHEAYASFQKNFTWDVVRNNYCDIVQSTQLLADSDTLPSRDSQEALAR